MADNLDITGPLDGKLINVNQDHEVKSWCKKFSCTEEELKAAVKAVGVSAKDVEKHLA